MAKPSNVEAIQWLASAGGSAFPADITLPEGGTLNMPGMTLRDWFAGQALASFVPDPPQNKAEAAYAIADAMLAERSKAGGE